MSFNFKPILASTIMALASSGALAYEQPRDYRDNRGHASMRDNNASVYMNGYEYRLDIPNRRQNMIRDFEVDLPRLRPGQIIYFYAQGQRAAAASVQFSTGSRYRRDIALQESSPGVYTGSYVIRAGDNLEGQDFTLMLKRGKNIDRAFYQASPWRGRDNYRPHGAYDGNDYRNNREVGSRAPNWNSGSHAQINSNYGTISRVEVRDARPGELNLAGTAVGALLGGVLGNQVGGGSGKKAATVIGAIAGGAAGNQIGSNMGEREKLWSVFVDFEDGTTAVYQYPNNPQVVAGQKVRKEGDQIALR